MKGAPSSTAMMRSRSRQSTGVGAFVNIVPGQVKFVLPDGTSFVPSFAAGAPQNSKANGVPFIGAVVFFEAEFVDFIEFHVNGDEPWSGDIDALLVEDWDDVPGRCALKTRFAAAASGSARPTVATRHGHIERKSRLITAQAQTTQEAGMVGKALARKTNRSTK